MVIVVTGDLGVGKTTVCRRLIAMAKARGYACGGVLSYGVKDGIIIEDVASGDTEKLASVEDIYDGPSTPKYHFNPRGIEFGLKAIERATSADLLVVDEIGHIERRGEGFARVLELIEGSTVKNFVVVIRSELLPAFMVWLPTAVVFPVTVDNRERLADEIGAVIFPEVVVGLPGRSKKCNQIGG